MGNKIVTLVTSFIILMVFVLLVAFISTDSQIRESERLVREFTETVQYKGCITYDQYTNLINSIPFSNASLQLTHIIDNDQIDSNVLDMRFTAQILSGAGIDSNEADRGFKIGISGDTDIYSGSLLYNSDIYKLDSGIYKMNVGDQIKVDLILSDDLIFYSIVSALTGSTDAPMKKIISTSGAILNTKYEK